MQLFREQKFWQGLWIAVQSILLSVVGASEAEILLADGVVAALMTSGIIEGDIRWWGSRRLWVAIVALAQSIVLGRLGVTPAIWGVIDGVAMVMINAFAIADVRAKAPANR